MPLIGARRERASFERASALPLAKLFLVQHDLRRKKNELRPLRRASVLVSMAPRV